MSEFTIAEAAIYVAAFMAACMAGWSVPNLVTDVVRRRRKPTKPSDPQED